MRILTLALGIPFPPLGGGLTRTFHLLKALSSDHEVTLAGFTYGEEHEAPPFPVNVEPVPWEWSSTYRDMIGGDMAASHRAYEQLTFEEPAPWFASVMDCAAMEQTLRRLLHEPPDVVLLEGTPLARFLPSLPAAVPCVLDLFDVHSVMAQRAIGAAPVDDRAAHREAARTLAFERAAVLRCVACLAVSDADADAARTLLGATQVHVIPNGVDTSYFTPSAAEPRPGGVLFTGRMNYEPNADAACYFADEILPLIRRDVPHATMHVVGASPPPRVLALQSDAVVVHGRVDDVRPHFSGAEVVVVPVRAGGGTRLKVLEAAASGKAIVSTSLGVEGLAFVRGRDLLVADGASNIAAAVVTLLQDRSHRVLLGECARAAARPYDWTVIGERLRSVVAGSLLRDA